MDVTALKSTPFHQMGSRFRILCDPGLLPLVGPDSARAERARREEDIHLVFAGNGRLPPATVPAQVGRKASPFPLFPAPYGGPNRKGLRKGGWGGDLKISGTRSLCLALAYPAIVGMDRQSNTQVTVCAPTHMSSLVAVGHRSGELHMRALFPDIEVAADAPAKDSNFIGL